MVINNLVESLEVVDSSVMSTYLSAKFLESKIHCLVHLFKCIYEYGKPEMMQAIERLLVPRLGSLLARLWDQLFVPLSRDDDILISEKDRVEAILLHIRTY